MSRHTKVKRITAPKIRARKGAEPIVCLTAYSAPIAKLMDPYVDLILVGDSAANVVHGFDTTIGITLEHMIMHGQAVMRGSERACVVVDLPFGSYEESPEVAYRSAARVMKETGCSAVKLEGGVQMADTIRFLVDRGIPVMAHVGLRPQAVQTMGGYRTSGRDRTEWPQIEADALAVQEAGAFAVVLEGMAAALADRLTDLIEIPTIGIGASARCDGQILVVDDMLGLTERVPCFVRKYADMAGTAEAAIRAYSDDVKGRTFPAEEHTFQMRKKA